MIKKVVIAAAGKGKRMIHLTKNKPKHLINVKGKPFLYYLFKNILAARYREIILVVGYKKELFNDFLKKYNFKAELLSQFDNLGEKNYGTLCVVKSVEGLVKKENFIVVYGDNLYSVKDLKSFNIEDSYNYIAGLSHKNPEKYGVLLEKAGFLEKIIEKPKKHIGNLINVGLYKFTPEIFQVLPKVKISPRGEYELTDAVSLLAKKKKVKVKRIQDYWMDFGRPSDIIKLSRFLKEKEK